MILSIYRKLLCLSAGKKSASSTGCQHFGPSIGNQNFPKYGIGGEISTTILAVILGYFQEKLFKFLINFSKNSKKNILRPIWVLFAKIWSKINFREKEGSASF